MRSQPRSRSQANLPFAITNKHENTFLNAIKFAERKSTMIRIAVAYVDALGAEELCEILQKSIKRGCTVELLLGTSKEINSPAALKRMLMLESIAKPKKDQKIEVRVSRLGLDFHPKTFLFQRGSRCTAIVGSANATNKGLNSESEIGVMLRGSAEDPLCRELISAFDGYFVEGHPLKSVISLSIEAYNTEHRKKRKGKNKAWSRLLRKMVRSRRPRAPEQAERVLMVGLYGTLHEKIIKQLSKETAWDENSYDYFGESLEGYYRRYRRGDRLALFDKEEKTFRWGIVRDMTQIIPVVKGQEKRFVAYEKIGRKRALSDNLKTNLVNTGIFSSKRDLGRLQLRVLSPEKKEKLLQLAPSKRI